MSGGAKFALGLVIGALAGALAVAYLALAFACESWGDVLCGLR